MFLKFQLKLLQIDYINFRLRSYLSMAIVTRAPALRAVATSARLNRFGRSQNGKRGSADMHEVDSYLLRF